MTFTDGSTVAQAARPDMRLPIQLALSWPARWDEAVPPLAARELSALSFEPLVVGRWPAYDLALAAGRVEGTAPCVLNAADEEAVEMFLAGRITLGQVPAGAGARAGGPSRPAGRVVRAVARDRCLGARRGARARGALVTAGRSWGHA